MTTCPCTAECPGGEAHRVSTSCAAPLTPGARTVTGPSHRPAQTHCAVPDSCPRRGHSQGSNRPRTGLRRRQEPCSGPAAGLPPGAQLRPGALLAERSMLHPQLEQVLVRLAHLPTGRQVQQLHDPVPVEIGADPADLLLLRELVDALLELVVGAGEGTGLALVAGGDVRAGEAVEVLEQVPGIGDITAHGRVRPG